MATATPKTETVLKGITLELSLDEAIYLRDLLGNTSAFDTSPGTALFEAVATHLPKPKYSERWVRDRGRVNSIWMSER